MTEFVELRDGEQEILPVAGREDDELLWRQIADHSWDATYGQPGSNSFGPMPVDKGMPSFSRQSKVTAQESRTWHNENAKSPSKGVWACSVSEVEKAKSRAIDDSETPEEPGAKRAPGHAFVDYRHLMSDRRARADLRAELLMYALERGEIPTVDPGATSAGDDGDNELMS